MFLFLANTSPELSAPKLKMATKPHKTLKSHDVYIMLGLSTPKARKIK
jgi:hypothetical protein